PAGQSQLLDPVASPPCGGGRAPGLGRFPAPPSSAVLASGLLLGRGRRRQDLPSHVQHARRRDPSGGVAVLTAEEREAFRKDGFVKREGVLSEEALDVCRRRTETCMADEASGAIFRYGDGGRPIHCKIPQLAERDDVFRGIAQHSEVAEAVEDLLGPSRIFRDVVIVKSPIARAVVHYHQDAAYWDIDRPELALSAWIALDDAPQEAGCLQVVPGSHRGATEHTILVGGRRLPDFITRSLRRATSLTGTGDNPQT